MCSNRTYKIKTTGPHIDGYFQAVKTSTSNFTKRCFSKSFTHITTTTDENPRTCRIFWDHSETLKDLTFHVGSPMLPSESHTRLPKALQPVLSHTSAPEPGDSRGWHRERLLSSMTWNHHDTWGPMSEPGRRKWGREGDCEALECPLAQKVDAQLDLEKMTKSWCPIRFRKSSSL